MRKMQIVVVFAVLVSAAVAQDSLNCREKGSWPFGPSSAVACDPSRNLAFCGSGGGVYVLDVSNPAAPQKLSEAIHTRGLVDGLCYQANRLYIAAELAGLEVWDVTDPQAPTRLGCYATPDEARGVAVAGDYAYVADGGAGLRVIEFYGGGVEESFKPQAPSRKLEPTVVRGVLFLAGASSQKPQAASLLDVSGRAVLDLHLGPNDVSRLSPGVYFVRTVSGKRSAESYRKVVIQR